MAGNRNVIILKSFDLEYLQQVKDFIHCVAPHIDCGLYSASLDRWETLLQGYAYNTVEWSDDFNFLFYGHGAKTSDKIFEVSMSMSLGEL